MAKGHGGSVGVPPRTGGMGGSLSLKPLGAINHDQIFKTSHTWYM